MNLTFYCWLVIFIASCACLVTMVASAIKMNRFYRMMNQHVLKETEKSDHRIYDEIELVEYTDEECGRNK